MSTEKNSRQEEIVKWISQAPTIGIPMKGHSREGFFVNRGTIIKLRSTGEDVDAMDWLKSEGPHDGMYILGYSIAYTAPGSEFGEKLSFFKTEARAEAPF